MFDVRGIPLCLACQTQLSELHQRRDRAYKEEINYLLDQVSATVGFDAVMPRYDLSEPVSLRHKRSKVTYNNIQVSNSVVGTINTADVHSIDVSLDRITVGGDKQLSSALAEFTQAVVNTTQLTKVSKDEVLELLASIASEAAKAPKERKSSVIKALVMNVQTVVSIASSLVMTWDKLHPLLKSLENLVK